MAREQSKPTDWREEIGKTLEAAEPEKAEKEEEPEVKAEKPEKERDETGKFKAKEETTETTETEETTETAEVQEPEKPAEIIEPPAHFTADEKKYFESLPPEQQKWIAGSVKRLSSTVDKRFQEYSTHQRRAQAFDEALAPYRQQLAMRGVDEMTAIKQLFTTYDQLQRDPVNTIKWLAKSYGVDLTQAQEEQDPQAQALMNQIAELKQGFSTIQGSLHKERENQMLNVVTQFSNEKDAQGNIKHPHFEVVVNDMMKLIQAGIVPPMELETAYKHALTFHPELNTVPQVPQVPPAPKTESDPVKEAAEKAARAKKAAAGVKSGAGSPKTEAPKTQRQVIEELVSKSMQ